MRIKRAVTRDRRRIGVRRFGEIATQARKLWFDFARQRGKSFVSKGKLFDPEDPFPLNAHAQAFFNYCVQRTLKVEESTILLARLSPPLPASGPPKGSATPRDPYSRSAPSWLYHRHWRVAWVVLDLDQVAAKIEGDKEIKKIATRLLLHEAGHLVLHFKKLRARKKSGKSPAAIPAIGRGVPSVNEAQEEEAWIFCAMIVGLALGQMARKSRPRYVDRAWPLAC